MRQQSSILLAILSDKMLSLLALRCGSRQIPEIWKSKKKFLYPLLPCVQLFKGTTLLQRQFGSHQMFVRLHVDVIFQNDQIRCSFNGYFIIVHPEVADNFGEHFIRCSHPAGKERTNFINSILSNDFTISVTNLFGGLSVM